MTKNELRRRCREERKDIKNKAELDRQILERLISLDCYKSAKTVLCYMSLDGEINTEPIAKRILSDKKRLAVPCCRDRDGNMDFYYINSLSELKKGLFNVLEPNTEKAEKMYIFDGSMIIVPALCVDESGYRLGYGKGYYDRFLKNYPFISVGLCYNSFIKKEIPRNNYDISLDIIVTDSSVLYVNNGGKNG